MEMRGELQFDRPPVVFTPVSRGSQTPRTRRNSRGSREWKRSDGAWRFSALIYGQLRTAYYRHVQLILPSVFLSSAPFSLSHLCVASPSSSPTTPDLLSHRSPSLSLLLSRFIPLRPPPPPRPPFSPNHLTSHRPSVCSPFLPLYPRRFAPVSRLLSPSLPVPLVPVLLSIQQVPGHASQISHVRGGDAEITTASARARSPRDTSSAEISKYSRPERERERPSS